LRARRAFLPQDVNYAVKASYARPLLEGEGFALLQPASAYGATLSPADLVAEAKRAVVLVIAK
jgi:hypothetical protein